MQHQMRNHHWKIVLLAIGMALPGCGTSSSIEGPPPDPTAAQLRSLATAYTAAANKLGRPPKSLDELKPYLQDQGNPDDILRSSRDGQPFEIIWGVDLVGSQGEGMGPMRTIVLAYERQGSGGKRWVVTQSNVTEMTDDEFAKLNIPKPAPKK